MTANSAPTHTPTDFDALIKEGIEKLVWATPKPPLSFRFSWEKVSFSAKLTKVGDKHRLVFLGNLGPLPYSAEDPDYRERLLMLLAWKPDEERIRFVMDPIRHQIYLMIDDILEGDLTGTHVISSAITSLLLARPYLELAREIGWQHPTDTTPRNLNVIPHKVNED
ncbi:MAG: hypothetical protein JKY12_03575 [Sneathiella sp.]|nr:hypothetical protein [Sneathiella sp.]